MYAFDINMDLINCYNVIKTNVEELINELELKEKEFLAFEDDVIKKFLNEIVLEFIIEQCDIDINKLKK